MSQLKNKILVYLELCKPRVVLLMLLTVAVGMQLAAPGLIPLQIFIFGIVGIALCAGSAATINHLLDFRIDVLMARTQRRPLPTGKIAAKHAWCFAIILCVIGTLVLITLVNVLTTVLTLLTLIGYAGFYTLYLKRATPQNIVIGGLAGAAPPLLGWTAVTGHLDPYALLLVLIIFVWTPPHFWALAIARYEEYALAKIPMLPVTHGIRFTKLSILLYTILLIIVSVLPFVAEMSGYFYLVATLILDAIFLWYAINLWRRDDKKIAMQTFRYSIIYLLLLFVVLLIDHFL
jgi:heme o synthase